MMTSRALKAVSRDSTAALEKWRRAAQEINLMNSLEPSPGNGDPRFICDAAIPSHISSLASLFIQDVMIDNPDFAQLTPHKQFNLLFQFQAQCAANALSYFDFGGRSMHGYACKWLTGQEQDNLSAWQQKHNELGVLAPRRSHLLQVLASFSLMRCCIQFCMRMCDITGIVAGYCVFEVGDG